MWTWSEVQAWLCWFCYINLSDMWDRMVWFLYYSSIYCRLNVIHWQVFFLIPYTFPSIVSFPFFTFFFPFPFLRLTFHSVITVLYPFLFHSSMKYPSVVRNKPLALQRVKAAFLVMAFGSIPIMGIRRSLWWKQRLVISESKPLRFLRKWLDDHSLLQDSCSDLTVVAKVTVVQSGEK